MIKDPVKRVKKVIQEEQEHMRIADQLGWETLNNSKNIASISVAGEEKRKKLDRAQAEANRVTRQRGETTRRPTNTPFLSQ